MDWYPWYFTLYEADTLLLDPYQDGCYRRLIDFYMKTRKPLPLHDAALARIIGISESDWIEKAAAAVKPYFKATKEGLKHKRCEIELYAQNNRSTKYSENGKKGAKIKKEKRQQKQKLDKPPLSPAQANPKPTSSTGQDRTGQDNTEQYNLSAKADSRPDTRIDIFDSFWSQFPRQRRGDRTKTLTVWKRRIKEGADPQAMHDGLAKYITSKDVAEGFAVAAEVWLRNSRWEDMPIQAGAKTGKKSSFFEDFMGDDLPPTKGTTP